MCGMVSLAGLLGTFAILGPVGIDERWMAEFDDEAKKTWVAGDCLVVEHSEIVKVSKQQGKTRTTYYELQIFVDRLAERHGDGDSVVVQNGSLPVRPAYKYPHMSQSGASRRFQTKEQAQSFKASNFVGRERICYWDPSKPRWCVAMNNVGGDWAPVQASIVITVIGWLGPCFLFFCWGCLSVCCEDDREESSHGYDPYNRRGGPRPSYHDRAAAARAEAAALADAVRESDEAAQAIAAVEAATRREEEAAEAARRRAHSEMLKKGARVSFLGTYPGKITAVNFNGTFAILFDDGTKMPSAQAEKIELIAAAPVDSTVSTSSSTPPAQTVEEEVASNSPSQPAPSSSFQLARARSFQRARSVARAPFERARSFARGTPEAPPPHVGPSSFSAGEEIRINYKGSWCKGVVQGRSDDGYYTVAYTDGSGFVEPYVAASRLRRVQLQANSHPTCTSPGDAREGDDVDGVERVVVSIDDATADEFDAPSCGC